MSEDEIRRLKEEKKVREEAYVKLKGMIEGLRLTKLTTAEEGFLKVFETMANGFKNIGDWLVYLYESQIRLTQRIENLEKEVEQIKTFQDTLEKNR